MSAHTSRLAGVLLGVAGLALAGGSAASTGPLNYALYLQSFDPAHPNASSVQQGGVLPGGLKTDITRAWNDYLAVAVPQILQNVQQADWVKRGYTLYNARLKVNAIDSIDVIEQSAPGQSTIPPIDASHPMIVIRSTQARLDADSTTDLPDYPNPSFHVTFDMTVNVHLGLGPMATTVTVSGADVEFSNAAYFPDNEAAKLGTIIDALRGLFGVQSVAQKVAQGINTATINITGYLSKYVQRATGSLTQQYVQHGWMGAGIFLDQNGLSFVVLPKVTPNQNGGMSGTLTVGGSPRLAKASITTGSGSSQGASCAGVFEVHDSVQIQPPYVASLSPLAFSTVPPPTQSLDAQITVGGGVITPSSNGWSCQYAITGLARDFVNDISFHSAPVSVQSGGTVQVTAALQVNFASCQPSADTAIHAATRCLQVRACSSPLDIPAAPGAVCDLIGQVTVAGGSGRALQQAVTKQPILNTGDPASNAASRWSTGAGQLQPTGIQGQSGASSMRQPALGVPGGGAVHAPSWSQPPAAGPSTTATNGTPRSLSSRQTGVPLLQPAQGVMSSLPSQ